APLRPAVQREPPWHDVGVEQAARPQDPGHLADHRAGLAEVLEQAAREHHLERRIGEREGERVTEQRIAGPGAAAQVLPHRAYGVGGVVDRDETVRPFRAGPDWEAGVSSTARQ